MTKFDDTAARMGIAMRYARQNAFIPKDEIATLLGITPNELHEYEQGVRQLPIDIMQRIFAIGYVTIHIRSMEDIYRRKRHLFNKLKKLERERTKNAK